MQSTVSDQGDLFMDQLRRDGLARQRPVGYDRNRPPYDRRRPAIEELEIMGVKILDDLDDLDTKV